MKFITLENIQTFWNEIKSRLDNKVDKVSGKGLSTNDFDATAKKKIDNLTSTNYYNEATTSARGYMSASDKSKLNSLKTDNATSTTAGYMSSTDKKKLDECMRCKVLTQAEFNALSTTNELLEDVIYFIRR